RGDGAYEDGEVVGVAADAGGGVVDVEEALEQVGVLDLVRQLVEDRDLAVNQGLEAPRQVAEHLQLLFAARLAGEAGGLHDGGDGTVVGAGEVGGEQVEVVGARGRFGGVAAGGRAVAAAQVVDQGAQVGLAAGGAPAQGREAVVHQPGGAVGGHRRDDDAGERHRHRPAEHRPHRGAGP